MKFNRIKITFLLILTAALPANSYAQKQDASAAVKSFYQFHFSQDSIFNKQEVSRRHKFFTLKLRRLFNEELKREKIYIKKYPTNKPFFDVLPFQPIEFCQKDYSVGNARVKNRTAIVKVNFVYGKSSCDASDGTLLLYKIQLTKIGGKWLIDNVIYDDGTTLVKAFGTAQKIK